MKVTGALNLLLGLNQVQEATVVSNGYTGTFGSAAGANVKILEQLQRVRPRLRSRGIRGNALGQSRIRSGRHRPLRRLPTAAPARILAISIFRDVGCGRIDGRPLSPRMRLDGNLPAT